MMTIIGAFVALHVTALAGVLLLSRYSTVLVDEDFRPLRAEDRGEAWRERVVQNHDASMTARRR